VSTRRAARGGGDGLVSPDRRYPLELDQAEVERYRMMAEAARQAEADLWERAGMVAGTRVADVGCGPGAMLAALAVAVGQQGRVMAVDADPEAVAAATALVAAAGLGNVAVREGRAEATGLAAGSLDVVMLRHVLAHNGGAEDVIVAHLATLLRPGGCLYLVDADGTAIRVIPEAEHPDLVDLQDRYLAFRTARGDDNAAGLRLAERLVRAGLELVEFRGRYVIREVSPTLRSPAWAAREAMVTAGIATTEDLRRWDRAFEATGAAARPPTFFAPMFTAVGRRRPNRTGLGCRLSSQGLTLPDIGRSASLA
jgi:SAM-dependent methyltransferase